jgi:hypothetical protein
MTEVAPVSVWRYVCLFALVYVLLILATGIALTLLQSDFTQMNVACLAIASVAVAFAFARKHRRSFVGTEYWVILTGCIVVDLISQMIPATPMLLAGKLPIGAFLLVGVCVSLLRGLLLAFMFSSRMVSAYVPKSKP